MAYTTITAETIGFADGDASPQPLDGTVRITPRFSSATVPGGFISSGPVVVEVVNGQMPRTLIPSKADATGLVEFHLYDRFAGPVKMPETEVPLEPDATISLSDYLPVGVDETTGRTLARGDRGYGITSVSGQNGDILITWDGGENGETLIPMPDAIEGPKGDTGPRGLQGERGPQGYKGDVGSSAYQVAVAGGFTGTEAEWLASLQGQDGVDGRDGADGEPGPRGPKGRDGDIVGVGIPLFDSRAAAAEWEMSNPGRRALWADGIPEIAGLDNGLVPTRFDAMTGMPPSGWTAQWNTTAKTAKLVSDGHLTFSQNEAARWAFTHDITGDVDDVDLVTKIRMYNAGGASNQFMYGLIAGVSGSAGNETGTYMYAFSTSSIDHVRVRLGEYNGGSSSADTHDTQLEFSEWTWIRMNVSGTTLRVKVWADLLDEPEGWTWEKIGVTEKTGRIGFFNSGVCDADVAYFNASTSGTAGIA